MKISYTKKLRTIIVQLRRSVSVLLAIVLSAAPIAFFNATASADQVTSRSVLISSGQASKSNVTYTVTFTPAQTTQIQSFTIKACTTALGTCTAPTGMVINGASNVTLGTSSFQGATAFTKDTTTAGPGCNTSTVMCGTRTDTTAQTTTSRTITISGTAVTNQNNSNCSGAANCTFFLRIGTFSDTAYATPVDTGTVASSTTQLFTVNAAIQETLSFCIGATSINDVTTAPPNCSSVSGTSLSLGVLDASHTNVSPVGATLNGDANNGIGELSTNAVNGSTVSYDAIQQSGTNHQGTLRVVGASCNAGNINTDQCIDAVGTTLAHLTAGTEKFGMTVAGVNCAATTAYTCAYTSGSNNLKQTANYTGGANNTTYDTDTGQVSGSTSGFYAWDETGTAQNIATSSTVVDREAMILKFAATPNLVTPTGSYTAQADFVATPTY